MSTRRKSKASKKKDDDSEEDKKLKKGSGKGTDKRKSTKTTKKDKKGKKKDKKKKDESEEEVKKKNEDSEKGKKKGKKDGSEESEKKEESDKGKKKGKKKDESEESDKKDEDSEKGKKKGKKDSEESEKKEESDKGKKKGKKNSESEESEKKGKKGKVSDSQESKGKDKKKKDDGKKGKKDESEGKDKKGKKDDSEGKDKKGKKDDSEGKDKKEKKDDGKKEVTKEDIVRIYKDFINKSSTGELTRDDVKNISDLAQNLPDDIKDFWNSFVLSQGVSNSRLLKPVPSPHVGGVTGGGGHFIPIGNFNVNVTGAPDENDTHGVNDSDSEIKDTDDSEIWKHLKAGARQEWHNQTHNQVVQPLFIYKPTTLFGDDNNALEHILRHALLAGLTVKPVGSGHSYSDCMVTNDLLIDTHGMDKVASKKNDIAGQLSPDVLREGTLPLCLDKMKWKEYQPEQNRALLELENGVRLIDLNKVLDQRKVGLMNMGGYDHQTIMGVISTSTHGSGITIGAFCDMVKSLVIATTGTFDGKNLSQDAEVYFYRIEPTNGITDPAKYKDDKIQLIQDDECFYSATCNMGCFGVVYSVVIEVMQKYWLREDRTQYQLDEVLEMLRPNPNNEGHNPDLLQQFRNMEILVHPYPLDNKKGQVHEFDPKDVETVYPKVKCLITQRNIVPEPGGLFHKKGHRDIISGFLSQFNLTFEATIAMLNAAPLAIPGAIDLSLDTLVDKDYETISHDIYVLGLNGNAGFACEISYPLEDDDGNYTDVLLRQILNRILIIAQKARINGFQFQTSPFSLRFVKKSSSYMSMMHGRNSLLVEYDMITGTLGGYEVMKRFESQMYDLGGRPHWGLDFDWNNTQMVPYLYPKYPIWKKYFDNFNAKGTFNNSFTNRMGFWNYNVLKEKNEE